MAETNSTRLSVLYGLLEADESLRSIDWVATSLGAVREWPEALKLSLGLSVNSPLPQVICWGTDLNCIYNNTFRVLLKSRHFGLALPGTPLVAALPTVYKEVFPSIQKVLGKNEPVCNNQLHIQESDNAVLPEGNYNILCQPIFESDDHIGGILLTVIESGVAVRSSDSSATEAVSLNTILDLVSVGIAQLSGDDFSVQYVNNVFSELAGKSLDYFLNKSIFDLFPDKREYFTPIFEKVIQTCKAVQQKEVPVKFLREGVSVELFLNLVFYPIINGDGLPDSVMVIAVDETDIVRQKKRLKIRENLFSNMVDHSRMGFLILRGEQFIVEYANETIYNRIWKIGQEKVLGKPLFQLFPELENQKYASQIRDVYYHQKSISEKRSFTFINTGLGMEEFYLDYEYAPLLDAEGNASGVSVNVYDVTAEVNMELKKMEAQQLLELSLEATGLALWELDPAGNVRHTDELWKILGCPPGYPLSLERFRGLLHPRDREVQEHAFKTALETGLYEYDARINSPSGKLVHIRVRGKLFFDKYNNPEKIIGTTRDITQEKKSQRELIRKEQRLRQLILQAPVAIGILRGPDYKVEIINDVARALLGRTDEQLLGNPILSVMNEVDISQAKYLLDKVFHKGETVSAKEYPVKILRDGKMVKIYVNFEYDPIRNERNEVMGVMVVGMEVTEQVRIRKKIEASEQQFRLLANAVPHLVWISDTDGHILFTNQTLEHYSGRSLEDFASGGIFQSVHPDDKDRVQEKWDRSLKTSTEFIDEHRVAGKDGRYRWYLTRAVPLKTGSDQMQTWIATGTDIQEMKEQDFQKDYFISRASHELKTPITSLKGYAQILMNVYGNSPESLLNTSLERMHVQINKLTRLIEELLDTTRLNRDELDIEKESTNLIQLVRESIADISTAYPNFEIEFENTEAIILPVDKSRMIQVINNLLTNAIKYSPDNKTILVAAGVESNMAWVSVKDHGIGIDHDNLKNIFEKFYRVTGKNEDTFPGFGIGLFLVNEIVKRHGGHVDVNSQPGKGSCFTIYLPVAS